MTQELSRLYSRRGLLRGTVGLGALSLLAACAPAAPAAPTTAPTAAPKPAATTAPAPATSPAPAASAAASPAALPVASPAVAASPAAAASPVAPGQTTVANVKLGASPGIATSGMFIGMDRGYFKDQGIEVEFVPFAGAADMVSSLAGAQLDIGNVDAGAGIWNVLARNIQMRFVADGNHAEKGHSQNAWVIRKDLIDSGAFKGFADLKGKTVSPIGKGSLIDSQFYRTIDQVGLKDADMDVKYIAFADCLPALANKALDAAILNEPSCTQAVDQGIGVRFKGMDEVLGNEQGTMITYSEPFQSQRKDVGNRLMVGYIRGIRDYIDAFNNGKDFDAIVTTLTKYTTLKDPALYKKIVVPAFDPNGAMLVDTVVNLEKWFVDHGFVQTPVDATKYFDDGYRNYALGIVGKR